MGNEPFRLFFPAGVLAGIVGVLLWPLSFTHIIPFYPGPAHIRLMAYGFFGAFILGFLGTAMPRMLSAKRFGVTNVGLLFAIYLAMCVSYACGKVVFGDGLLLALLVVFLTLALSRARARKDTPPPGFVLVGLAWLCVGIGAVLAIIADRTELDLFWVSLQRLLSSQGFVLLPILGIGPFLLPRFFGMESAHDFPEMLKPSPQWKRKALFALVTGLLIIASFIIEANAKFQLAYALRFLITTLYLALEFPFRRAPKFGSALGASLWLSFIALVAGFFCVAIFPSFRVSLLHLTLVGGFAVITFVVATRVVFGHSGNIAKLKQSNWWLLISVALMLFAMATRISGDFVPKIMATHYSYGAVVWVVAVLIWSFKVLPKVRQAEKD